MRAYLSAEEILLAWFAWPYIGEYIKSEGVQDSIIQCAMNTINKTSKRYSGTHNTHMHMGDGATRKHDGYLNS